MSKKKIRSIFVEAREYFDKTGGNTYFSARISINGDLVGYLPFQYGYGSMYEWAVMEVLKVSGYDLETSTFAPLYQLRNEGVHVYTVKYSATMRDTKRFGIAPVSETETTEDEGFILCIDCGEGIDDAHPFTRYCATCETKLEKESN